MSEIQDNAANIQEFILNQQNFMEKLPELGKTIIPLSETDLSAKNYMEWKKLGVMEDKSVGDGAWKWVKLNFFEYVWINACIEMRKFGLPLDCLKNAREFYLGDYFKQIKDFEKQVRLHGESMPQRFKDHLSRIFQDAKKYEKHIEEKDKIYFSFLGNMVCRIIRKNEDMSLLIFLDENEKYQFTTYSREHFELKNEIFEHICQRPHLFIPVRPLMERFLDTPRSEKWLEEYNLLNEDEKKLLEVLRKRDFKQIIIKRDRQKDYTIDLIKDKNILREEAEKVRKILGMKDYSEVHLKQRNEKDIYFENTIRIK